jgi:hypothetical protein
VLPHALSPRPRLPALPRTAGGADGGEVPQHEPGGLAAQVRKGAAAANPFLLHRLSTAALDRLLLFLAALCSPSLPASCCVLHCTTAHLPQPWPLPSFATCHRRYAELQQRHSHVSRELEALEISLGRAAKAAAAAAEAAAARGPGGGRGGASGGGGGSGGSGSTEQKEAAVAAQHQHMELAKVPGGCPPLLRLLAEEASVAGRCCCSTPLSPPA